MKERISISNWIDKFNRGDYSSEDVRVQVQGGWYDWFCKDSSLVNKTKKMGNIIKQVKDGGKVNLKDWYVWFKNNCPLIGSLYDDFRFARLETGDVQLTIQIDCCWDNHRFSVWGRRSEDSEFEPNKPLFETDSSRELVKWLNTPW